MSPSGRMKTSGPRTDSKFLAPLQGPPASPIFSSLKFCAAAGIPYPKTNPALFAVGIHILIVLFAFRQLT
eukprot:4449392-Pyramimonas_sp.AAC.1